MATADVRYTFVNVEDVNAFIVPSVVYVCKFEEVIYFECPCGCKALVVLSTLKKGEPRWAVDGNSVKPSIKRTVGCKTHFTITNGVVTFHNNKPK